MTLAASLNALSDAVAQEIKRLRAEIAELKQAQGSADGRKEYQEAYIPREDIKFPTGNTNNRLITIPFKQPFSKRPILTVMLDIQAAAPYGQIVQNITTESFDIATNYSGALKGLWYRAWVAD